MKRFIAQRDHYLKGYCAKVCFLAHLGKKEFYLSQKWRGLRNETLKVYGRKCMKCGTTEGRIHVDHIKPKSKYPELCFEFDNLQILCEDCNNTKGNVDETDYRPARPLQSKTAQAGQTDRGEGFLPLPERT